MAEYWLGPWKELAFGNRKLATPTGLITCPWNLEAALISKQRSTRGTAWPRTGLVCTGVCLQGSAHCFSLRWAEFGSSFGAVGTAETQHLLLLEQ